MAYENGGSPGGPGGGISTPGGGSLPYAPIKFNTDLYRVNNQIQQGSVNGVPPPIKFNQTVMDFNRGNMRTQRTGQLDGLWGNMASGGGTPGGGGSQTVVRFQQPKLMSGAGPSVVSQNIRDLMKSGYPEDQAILMAYRFARGAGQQRTNFPPPTAAPRP